MTDGLEGLRFKPEERLQLETIIPDELTVTEARRLLHELQVQRNFTSAILDTSGALVVLLDPDGRIVSFNRACEKTTGYSFEEVKGQLFWDLFLIQEEMEQVKIVFDDLKAGHFPNEHENYWLTKDGRRRWITWSNTAMLDESGNVEYVIGTGIDSTDRKQMHDALVSSERRVRLLNEHILNMLMVMSHDIRGPLVAMAATLKLLLRGSYGKVSESVGNTLKDLMSRAVQLLGIAEDCLGKAHVVEGSMEIQAEMLDLRQDIIDAVLDELSNEIERANITIDNRLGAIPAGTIPIHANRVWIKVVFRNLFKNAIKYGGKGCTIAFGFEDHDSFYRLNVYNSGKPVPEEKRDRLFTKFDRMEASPPGSPEGMGLGLYLIREIILKHGGDIWYEGKPDGSDFIFTIPKNQGDEPEPSAAVDFEMES